MRRLLLATLLVSIACRRTAPPDLPPPVELAEIEALEEARDAGERLVALCAAPDRRVRARALVALARVADPSSAAAARARLGDAEPDVRSAAAFAIERIADGEGADPAASEAALAARLAVERQAEPRRRALRALGRIGSASGEALLAGALAGPRREADSTVRVEAGRALVVYGARGRAALPATREALVQALSDGELSIRLAAAQALQRLKARPEEVPALAAALRDVDATVRAAAVRALGTVAAPAAPRSQAAALLTALDDPAPFVRVEAARAVATIDRARVLELAMAERRAAAPDHLVVALAALEALEPGAAAAPPIAPLSSLPPPGDPASARAAALFRCRWEALRVRAGAPEESLLGCASDEQVALFRRQMLLAAALGDRARVDPARLPRLLALAGGPDGRVRAAALEPLGAIVHPSAAAAIRAGLSDEDPGALEAACGAAAAAARDRRSDPEGAARIARRLPGLPTVSHVEAIIGCIDALRALAKPGDAPAIAALRPRLSDENGAIRAHARDALAWLLGRAPSTSARAASVVEHRAPPPAGPRQLTLATSRGEVVLELLTDETPRTAAAFATLARRRFFDDLTFHRVVPDFVVQGGDPRGDGYGGPGFLLLDEATPRHFARGVVGVALAGPDTGGSQLFVCQTDSPHLDGKFTAFARVVRGMEAVDQLVPGDALGATRVTP